ncbi:MAG: hypothetical protein IT256_03275 [Chitinophagaceae bacterium]|nr:hypothetical protein [Chitinophagaceae bacterium]
MKFTQFFTVAATAILLCNNALAQVNKFVDSTSGSDANTGNSWAAAYKTMDKALNEANAATSIKTISVAKGHLLPWR